MDISAQSQDIFVGFDIFEEAGKPVPLVSAMCIAAPAKGNSYT